MARILIADDEELIAIGLSLFLEQAGHVVVGTAATADEAVELARMEQPDLVVMDIRLKHGSDGVDAAQRIRRNQVCPTIFLTGSREPATVARINAAGPADLLFKPVLPRHLLRSVETVLARS